ncbi:hypothetical protein RFI_11914, partial [Reticulomyxa filosa]
MLVLVTSISGTILKNLQSLGWDFSKLIQLMGLGLSQMGVYFMMYLLNLALFQTPIQLFRIGYWVNRWMFHNEQNNFDYWDTYPNFMIGLLLCITYGAMSPLIWIIGLLYFGVSYTVLTYQLSMCFINENEGGLELWPPLFNRLMIGVQIGNITLMVLLLLKKGVGPAVAVLLLLIV